MTRRRILASAAVLLVVVGFWWGWDHKQDVDLAVAQCQVIEHDRLVTRDQARADAKTRTDQLIAAGRLTGTNPGWWATFDHRAADSMMTWCQSVNVYIDPVYTVTRMPTDAEIAEAQRENDQQMQDNVGP